MDRDPPDDLLAARLIPTGLPAAAVLDKVRSPVSVYIPAVEQTDERWMALALAEADAATQHGDVPIGAVVVDDAGQLLARAHNRREADADPTAHAEILALRTAAAQRGHWRLHDCTLYVTLEPCCMCAGALVNARLGRLVYGAADPKAGAIESLYSLHVDERLNHRFTALGGVAAEQSRERLQRFFQALRARGEK